MSQTSLVPSKWIVSVCTRYILALHVLCSTLVYRKSQTKNGVFMITTISEIYKTIYIIPSLSQLSVGLLTTYAFNTNFSSATMSQASSHVDPLGRKNSPLNRRQFLSTALRRSMSSSVSVNLVDSMFSTILVGVTVFGMTTRPRWRAKAMHT